MADITILDALQTFYQELLAIRERRSDSTGLFENEALLLVFEKELEKVWKQPGNNDKSRADVKSGRVSLKQGLRINN